MGYYIATPQKLNKAEQLIRMGAVPIPNPEAFDTTGPNTLICVVRNGPFDAAGIAFNNQERDRFLVPDGRGKSWLSLPKETVVKLCPQVYREWKEEL